MADNDCSDNRERPSDQDLEGFANFAPAISDEEMKRLSAQTPMPGCCCSIWRCNTVATTTANIKNPPVIYAKQANIANGPQQVNNGIPAPASVENVIEPNKLLEHEHGQWLDTGTQGAAIGADKELETVGAIDRAEVGRG